MKWKVCGMREEENCVEVALSRPDFLGFIFVEKSPRFVGAEYSIPKSISDDIAKVGVFVDESVEKIVELSKIAGFSWVQLHGKEGEYEIEFLKKSGLKVIKAISVASRADVEATNQFAKIPDYFLFDTKKGAEVGGTGERFNWQILDAYRMSVPIILAGGLDALSIPKALELAKKYPIEVLDFNSKLEIKPGVKDLSKVKEVGKLIGKISL